MHFEELRFGPQAVANRSLGQAGGRQHRDQFRFLHEHSRQTIGGVTNEAEAGLRRITHESVNAQKSLSCLVFGINQLADIHFAHFGVDLNVQFSAAFHRHEAGLVRHTVGPHHRQNQVLGLILSERLLEVDRQSHRVASALSQQDVPATHAVYDLAAVLFQSDAIEASDRQCCWRAGRQHERQPAHSRLFDVVGNLVMGNEHVRFDLEE